MRSSRYPRGTCLAPGNMPASVSCFSRTSRMTGLGDWRDSSRGWTSGTRARASLSNSDFVFMGDILAHCAARQAGLVRYRTTAHRVPHGGGMHDRPHGSILRRAGPLMLARLGVAAMTFAIPLVLARVLLPATYGTFKQAWLLSNTLYLVLPLGLTQSLVYFIPREPARTKAWITHTMVALAAL